MALWHFAVHFSSIYIFSLWLSSCAFATDESCVFALVPTIRRFYFTTSLEMKEKKPNNEKRRPNV